MTSEYSNEIDLHESTPLQSAVRIRYVPEWDAAIAYSSTMRNSIVLNRTAYFVYLLCDGARKWGDIVESYVGAFALPTTRNAALQQDANVTLNRLKEMGLIDLASKS